MISIDNFSRNITMNLLFEEKNFSHMFGCKNCGYTGMLHRHGQYTRNVITLYQHFPISVQRFLCPSCRKTYSRLPSCIVPYFIYSFDVIVFCLYSVLVLSHKLNNACRTLHNCNPGCFISRQSIRFFKKRFLSSLFLTNSFFALFYSLNYDMDLSLFDSSHAAAIVIRKIISFDIHTSFNFTFFSKMPKYFFSP
jgi:transposase-like protein